MKVLLVHNSYQSSAPSGEDAAYAGDISLLKQMGIEVAEYRRRNDEIQGVAGRISAGFSNFWSPVSQRQLVAAIRSAKPDVVHLHNLFPLISPSAIAACRSCGVPVVMTLHNYRLFCSNGLLLKDGRPCERCVGRSQLNGVIGRCYRNSATASALVAGAAQFHRALGTYERHVDRFIALTTFAKDVFSRGGLPEEKLFVRPNFVDTPRVANAEKDNYIVYAGRLSDEKGVRTMLEAWARVDMPKLKIFGGGPLEPYVRARTGPNVELCGQVSRQVVIDAVAQARGLVVPSEWYEGMPMVLLEAYANRTPVIAADIGSLATLVEDGRSGLKFVPGQASSLCEAVKRLDSANKADALGAGARRLYDERFSFDAVSKLTAQLYGELIDR